MLGVLYVSVNSKHYLMTIYKCVGKAEYIYQMDETYLTLLIIINTQDRGGRKYNFFSKKLITHLSFSSNIHTTSQNRPKLS